jgi:hypothetical protein
MSLQTMLPGHPGVNTAYDNTRRCVMIRSTEKQKYEFAVVALVSYQTVGTHLFK